MRRRLPALVLAGALFAGATVAAAGVAGASNHVGRSHSANSTVVSHSGTEPQGPRDGLHAGGLIASVSATSLTVTNPAGTSSRPTSWARWSP